LKTKPQFIFEEILPTELLAFCRNPFKWYYNKTLAIFYNEEEVLLPDTELFELDALQQWKLKNDLLKISATDIESYRLQALNTGDLPLKHMADIQLSEEQKTAWLAQIQARPGGLRSLDAFAFVG
jgi:exodeoxyribonuclease V gamma subunit